MRSIHPIALAFALGITAASAQTVPNAIVPSVRALDVVFGGENLNMGPTAGLQFVSHYLNAGAFYSMSSMYRDRIKSEAEAADLPFPTTSINDSRTLEAGAQLNLISWEADQDFDITDKVEQGYVPPENPGRPGGYSYTRVYYHVEQFASRMFIGVRGGYYDWGMPVSSASKSDSDPLLTTTGVRLGKTNLSQFTDVFTNVRTKSYYAGLAYSYFVYGAERYQTYYVDFFFNSTTHVDPILLNTRTFDIEGPGSRGFPVRKTGYRVGVEVFVGPISAKAEGGVRPGTYGGYVMLGAGFALPMWFW